MFYCVCCSVCVCVCVCVLTRKCVCVLAHVCVCFSVCVYQGVFDLCCAQPVSTDVDDIIHAAGDLVAVS